MAASLAEKRPIPACAGETFLPNRCPPWGAADPRVCGGDLVAEWQYKHSRGRSPRVRGRRAAVINPLPKNRPIPACAGETHSPIGGVLHSRADPRVCGGDWVTYEQECGA